jgi:hypothetical protein
MVQPDFPELPLDYDSSNDKYWKNTEEDNESKEGKRKKNKRTSVQLELPKLAPDYDSSNDILLLNMEEVDDGEIGNVQPEKKRLLWKKRQLSMNH